METDPYIKENEIQMRADTWVCPYMRESLP
ncbi:MAG: hypothetical protein K0R80_3336 [Clostridia bacterium]|nr:hypothetical protein [Clostridia bacterium]